MARRRNKKRTHSAPTSGAKAALAVTGNGAARTPKSMVIRIGAGEVGSSVSQLSSDVRRVMEPGTASRLKERRANRLRDYVTMCGPLGVTQLLLFSRSDSGNVNLRIAAAPRGPTLNFRVERYSLSKDVQRAQKHPMGGGKEYITPPLLVMNNFNLAQDSNANVPKHLESLITTSFQSLFPPINPQATPLASIRRVLLLNREQSDTDPDSFVLNFRHYAITTKTTGISKALKRLNTAEKLLHTKKSKKGGLPNLGKLQDISDYMVGGENGEGYVTDGGTSGSEAETDAEIEVLETTTRKVISAKARARAAKEQEQEQEGGDDGQAEAAAAEDDQVERRAVKLIELGPRMRLRLIKVEEGLCQGQVMWHEHIHKSQAEVRELRQRWETRKREKEARKKEQKDNVEKKKKAKQAKPAKGEEEGSDEEDAMDVDDVYDSDGYDGFDSEGLEGDAEMQINEKMEEAGEWEDEEDEIAGR